MLKRDKMVMVAGALFAPWMAEAVVSTSSSSQGSTYLPGESIPRQGSQGGYCTTAAYVCEDPWKLTLTGDYVYWIWQQAMMDVGILCEPAAQGSALFFNSQQDVIFQTPGYRSGFQLGVECLLRGMDDWKFSAEYTWYKNTSSLHKVASSLETIVVAPPVIRHISSSTPGTLLTQNLRTTARMTYNRVDLALERPFYFGRKLTANFKAAIEGLWISEKFTGAGSDLTYIGDNVVIEADVSGNFSSLARQKSWSVGPKFTFASDWLLGAGFKVMGEMSLSALYTSYITLSSSVSGNVSNVSLASLEIDQSDNYNTVNPVAEACLGLGWGTYFCDNRFHLDLSAGYDFKVYWSYNVLDSLIGQGSPGDMTLRGLNARARFDF